MPNFVQICAIVNDLWAIDKIQNGGRRHLEFIIFVYFDKTVCFWWQPATLLHNFIYLGQSSAELLMFVQKIQGGGRRHLGFEFCLIFWFTCMQDLQGNTMPNFVQICAIVNELWAIDEIQNGGRRHLEFIIFVHFGHTVYFRWQPATSL